MENKLILNVKIENSENGKIESITKIEKLLYFIIIKSLKNVPIEYLKNNDVKLNKYGFSISYNIYNGQLQFNNNDNYYLNNIRHILLKYNINNVIEYILIELEKYIINYYDYVKNNEQLINELSLIYL